MYISDSITLITDDVYTVFIISLSEVFIVFNWYSNTIIILKTVLFNYYINVMYLIND
jgi:hypothetical protein